MPGKIRRSCSKFIKYNKKLGNNTILILLFTKPYSLTPGSKPARLSMTKEVRPTPP